MIGLPFCMMRRILMISGHTSLKNDRTPLSQTDLLRTETFEKCSILVKIKEDENFNHRNPASAGLNISRIEIRV